MIYRIVIGLTILLLDRVDSPLSGTHPEVSTTLMDEDRYL